MNIDMQLSRPKLLLMLLQNTLKYDDNQETQNSVQNAIIDRLREIKGVVSVSC